MDSLQTEGSGQSLSTFASLGLAASIVRATSDESYTEPTPVQKAVVPHVIAGRDILACAQTGTGKTAAFVLPILHRLVSSDAPRDTIAALILTPTRELAAQISERISAYGRYLGIKHAVIYGGVSQYRQEQALRARPRLLVATPGRLLDLMNQGLVRLDRVAYFVLDEADRMLDMGFVNDVKKVAREVPKQRQTLLFSATVPQDILALANSLLNDPVRVDVSPKVTSAETVKQSVVFVSRDQKSSLLERVLSSDGVERAIVFTRTKHGANKLSQRLERAGIVAPAIHGNKSQAAREKALGGFRGGKTRFLVATDIAARGIDVDGISHVINYDLPNVPESYVHRVGRTGRAGATGQAISFVDRDERSLLRDIERLLRKPIEILDVKTFGELPARPAPQPQANAQGERPSPQGDARDNGDERRHGNERSRGDFRSNGERRSHGGFRSHGEQRPHGEQRRHGDFRPQGGQRHGGYRPHGEQRPSGDVRSNDGQRSSGGYRPQGEQRPSGDFRSNGGQPSQGGFRPQGDFRSQGEQRPSGDFRSNGSFGAPRADGSAPPRRSFGGGPSKRFGKRNSHW